MCGSGLSVREDGAGEEGRLEVVVVVSAFGADDTLRSIASNTQVTSCVVFATYGRWLYVYSKIV